MDLTTVADSSPGFSQWKELAGALQAFELELSLGEQLPSWELSVTNPLTCYRSLAESLRWWGNPCGCLLCKVVFMC